MSETVRMSEAVAAILDRRSAAHRQLADFVVAHESLILRALEREAERLSADPDSVFHMGPKAGDGAGAWGEHGGVQPETVKVDLGSNARQIASAIHQYAGDIRRGL